MSSQDNIDIIRVNLNVANTSISNALKISETNKFYYLSGRLRVEELLQRLKECDDMGDTEIAHSEADKALLEYIDDKEISKAFLEIRKWYA